MYVSKRLSSRLIQSLLAAAALLLPAALTLGDTVYIQSTANGTPLKRTNVNITKIGKDKDEDFESLYYSTDSGRIEHKDLSKVAQIEADNEPVFNQAEAEYAKGNLSGASEDYRRAMSASTKDWLKHRADIRVLGISSKTGDFLGAVAGWVEMMRKDPGSTAIQRPAPASAKPDQLPSAITSVNRGLVGASIETKMVLYPYLIELQNKNGDTAGASATLAALKALRPAVAQQNPAANPGNGAPQPAPADDPASMLAKQAEEDTALTKANDFLASKDYANVIVSINKSSAAFVDPDKQAKALYLLAEAKAGAATTPESWEDAALAYMRVVAHFKTQPQAADALYKTAAIEEKLSRNHEAVLIYNQVISEYADSKAAEQAKAAVARLSK